MSYCEEQYISALVKENHELKEQLNEIKSNKLNSMQIKVEVDTTEVDAAMKKATELLNVYKKIDILQARITRGSEIIEACAKKYAK